MKRSRARRRGFSLIIVLLTMALIAIIGTIVLSMVTSEERILGLERLAKEARFGAEGAAMEVLNDSDLSTMLPSYASGSLEMTYNKSTDSLFDRQATLGLSEITYDAEISLLRDTPVRESSLTVTRAFLYEVRVEARVAGDDASDEVTAQIFKVFTMPSGTVLPENHAR